MIEISIVTLIIGYISVFVLGFSISNLLYIRTLLKHKEVIRCKDCKHQRKHFNNGKVIYYSCDLIADPYGGAGADGEPEEYCSAAERRAE